MLPKNIFHRHSHIGIDLDETIASTMMDAVHAIQATGKLQQIGSLEDMSVYEWHLLPNSDMNQFEYEHYWRMYRLHRSRPIPGAIVGVAELMKKVKNISLITARNAHDHATDVKKWLAKYFPFIHTEDVFFPNRTFRDYKKKSTFCKQLGITLMIEDNLSVARDLTQNNIACIVLEKPWNRDIEYEHPLLYRVKDWQEIINLLNDQ